MPPSKSVEIQVIILPLFSCQISHKHSMSSTQESKKQGAAPPCIPKSFQERSQINQHRELRVWHPRLGTDGQTGLILIFFSFSISMTYDKETLKKFFFKWIKWQEILWPWLWSQIYLEMYPLVRSLKAESFSGCWIPTQLQFSLYFECIQVDWAVAWYKQHGELDLTQILSNKGDMESAEGFILENIICSKIML